MKIKIKPVTYLVIGALFYLSGLITCQINYELTIKLVLIGVVFSTIACLKENQNG